MTEEEWKTKFKTWVIGAPIVAVSVGIFLGFVLGRLL